MSTPSSTPSSVRILVLTGVLCLIWGSTWVVIKGGLQDLPPFTSVAVRFALAAAGMSLLAALFSKREGGSDPAPSLSLVLGLVNFGVSYGIVYWSETRLPSGLVALLWAVFPLCVAFWSRLLLPSPERLSPRQWLGFLGVGSLFATDLRAIGSEAAGAGAILLLSPLVSALGTTYVKKHGGGTSSLKLNRNGMWIGAALLGASALLFERDAPIAWTAGAILSVLYLSIFGTVIAFGLYFWLLRHTAANRLSVISYVTPAIALALGLLFKDEPVTPFTLAGLASILAGVFLVHRGGGRKRPELVESRAANS